MPKVTGKLQITLPKRIADEHGIRVGDEVTIESAGDRILLTPGRAQASAMSAEDRLASFDEASRRQQARNDAHRETVSERGWTRDELYDRDRPR